MQTVRLGRTDAVVGCVGLGSGGSRLGLTRGASAEEAARIVRSAIDLGVTFIDTAPMYETEEVVGRGIAGRRSEVFLSSKVSPVHGAQMLTAEELVESLHGSLSRLGTDHIDLFHLHGMTAEQYDYCAERLLPELKRRQRMGAIRFLGVSEMYRIDTRHEMLARCLPDDHFDVVMTGFNFINPSARRTVFPQTIEHDVGTLLMFSARRPMRDLEALRALTEALIARGELNPERIDPGAPLRFLTEHPDIASVAEAAFRFCRHEPGAHVILTGTGDVGHLQQNIAAVQKPPLPIEVLDRLRDLFGSVDSVPGS